MPDIIVVKGKTHIYAEVYDFNLIIFILFKKHSWSIYYIPGTILGIENMDALKHIGKYLCLTHFRDTHRITAAMEK